MATADVTLSPHENAELLRLLAGALSRLHELGEDEQKRREFAAKAKREFLRVLTRSRLLLALGGDGQARLLPGGPHGGRGRWSSATRRPRAHGPPSAPRRPPPAPS